MNLHIELEKWEEAFILAEKNAQLSSMIRVPYAVYLTKNNRFEEAIEAYKLANRPDLSMKILKQLSKNSALERRFKDAGHFFWLLALENLKLVKNAEKPNEAEIVYLRKFKEYNGLAELYVAFELVADYIE